MMTQQQIVAIAQQQADKKAADKPTEPKAP